MIVVAMLVLLLWLALGILGVLLKGLLWLAIIGFGLFAATGIALIARTMTKNSTRRRV